MWSWKQVLDLEVWITCRAVNHDPNQEPRERNQPLQPLCADVLCIHPFPSIQDLLDQELSTSSFFQATVSSAQPGDKV